MKNLKTSLLALILSVCSAHSFAQYNYTQPNEVGLIYICDINIKQGNDSCRAKRLTLQEPGGSCISKSEIHFETFVFKISRLSQVMMNFNVEHDGVSIISVSTPRGTNDVFLDTLNGTIRCHNKSYDLAIEQKRLQTTIEVMLADSHLYSKKEFYQVREEVLDHIAEGGQIDATLLSLFLDYIRTLEQVRESSVHEYKLLDYNVERKRLEDVIKYLLINAQKNTKQNFTQVRKEILTHIADGGEVDNGLLSKFLSHSNNFGSTISKTLKN